MRFSVMQNMLKENIGLTIGRAGSVVGLEQLWNLVFITTNLIDLNLYYRGGELLFPLEEYYKRIPTPEEILYYIYGIFYSNIYRETYAEFLKIDFPRVPFTSDENLFCEIGELGKQLADLHLLKSPLLEMPVARYQGEGDNDRIEKIDYQETEQRIYINNEKYFEGVAPEVWNYYIGGYQVLPKYLKDRKGRILEDAPH